MRALSILALAIVCLHAKLAHTASACGNKHTCREMADCADAVRHLRDCKLTRLDRDGDGIPCEAICGKTPAVMKRRLQARPAASNTAPVGLAALPTARFTCTDEKKYCRDMKSCAEARFHLGTCGRSRLDGNGDGIPCDALCR